MGESLKKVCVVQRGNKYYYPKTIPRRRGTLATKLSISAVTIIILVHYFKFATDVWSLFGLYVTGYLIAFFAEILHRIFMIAEEYQHLLRRYNNDISIPIKYGLMTENWKPIVFFLFCLIYFIKYHGHIFDYDGSIWEIVFVLLVIYTLCHHLELRSGPLYDSLWLEKENSVNYGSGMAYSYFYGYLNIILEKTGTEEKNIIEMMDDYESNHDITFNVKKLFILIPRSVKFYQSLSDKSVIMEPGKSLADKQKSVAGVRDRVYRNSVYKIKPKNGNSVYVCAEFGSPLKTFNDVIEKAGRHNEIYKRHTDDILLQFYLTLDNILKEKHWEEFCDLVFYEDKNSDGEFRDIGEILLARIKEIEKEKRAKRDKLD